MKIMTSLPFYAILFAHMGQNYGYETLMTELPTYMKQVLRFSIKEVSKHTDLCSDNGKEKVTFEKEIENLFESLSGFFLI